MAFAVSSLSTISRAAADQFYPLSEMIVRSKLSQEVLYAFEDRIGLGYVLDVGGTDYRFKVGWEIYDLESDWDFSHFFLREFYSCNLSMMLWLDGGICL